LALSAGLAYATPDTLHPSREPATSVTQGPPFLRRPPARLPPQLGVLPPGDWIRRWLTSSYVTMLEARPMTLSTYVWALAELG
jgi:hypothetical protein